MNATEFDGNSRDRMKKTNKINALIQIPPAPLCLPPLPLWLNLVLDFRRVLTTEVTEVGHRGTGGI